MGWSKLSGVVLNQSLKNYLDELSNRVPFDIVITSGIRTPQKQAAAMFEKIRLGDDLLAIYKDDEFAQKIIDVYPNLEAGTRIVQEYAAAGGGSTHLRGLGIDVRTRDLTGSQKQALVNAVESLGDFALLESTPPHLHISIKKNLYKGRQGDALRLATPFTLLILGVIAWMAT